MENNKWNNSQKGCSLKDVLDIIGGKWAMPIIYNLSKGKMRFMEIERTVAGINTRMLVKELKNLEANDIITRTVFATVPPTVEYELTNKGEKLLPSIRSLHEWGQAHAKVEIKEELN
jgi:DNA-binding HxlR family transcriptional regulator